MILKDIAQIIGMDISTVSRVASSKSVQTHFGTLPLKYFSPEGITTDTGEEVSSREKKRLFKIWLNRKIRDKPYSDDKLEDLFREKGQSNIARRIVAKYREQLNIPVARLRREI